MAMARLIPVLAALIPVLVAGQAKGDVCAGPLCEADPELSSLLQHTTQQASFLTAGREQLEDSDDHAGDHAAAVWSSLKVTQFVPYFNYQGPLKVTGSGTIDTGYGHQTLDIALKGVDPACSGNPTTAANSCGIHIHEGTDCFTDAKMHYWNTADYAQDPWKHVVYTAGKSGDVTVKGVKVFTGLSGAAIRGHTVIVHNIEGGRVSCGILENPSLIAPNIVPIPDYNGQEKITGNANVKGSGSGADAYVVLDWMLWNLPKMCMLGPKKGTENSCGIHIHEGMCCEEPGAHYYNKEVLNSDPWASVTYCGFPIGTAKVTTGFPMSSNVGRVLVVHDYAGNKVSCAVIQPEALVVPSMGPYPGYIGALQVSGSVKLAAAGGPGLEAAQKVSWSLSGVDPMCTEALLLGAPTNACGVHIHAGKSCANAAAVGGHYYETAEDPWKTVIYQAISGTAQGGATVVTGTTMADIGGRAFVVHDSTGGRVGCGIISPKTA